MIAWHDNRFELLTCHMRAVHNSYCGEVVAAAWEGALRSTLLAER